MLNGHGDDIYNYKKKIISNYSSNIYNKLDMSTLQQHLYSCLHTIHSYPEPDAKSLRELFAQKNNISSENICITNGAVEAIYLIAQAFKRKKGAILIPTFSEYEDACLINEISLQFVSNIEDINSDLDICWICNPNNPTGKMIEKEQIVSFIKSHPDIIIIIDQSYQYFTEKEGLTIEEAIQYPNVIIIHSLTKQFAIPGLRLGYIIASRELISLVRKYCMPWSVNQLAQEAGKYLIENEFLFSFDLKEYREETIRLKKELSRINGLEVYPTDTHFFLCKLYNNQKASDLKIHLADNYGILIRDAANFRGLNESYFRLATQSKNENNILVKAIKLWM